ncbi:hypothetical protein SNE40_019375 [Patella caerulea]|uniref:Hcy-binding domain-containing protein n=1 Tax=Patella caerulea TaxID=87958 RepID=A0AAN8P9I0_PATCE
MTTPGFLERLSNGGSVIVAEGYLFEFERRGYLKAGSFVPEVVIDHPHLVRNLYEEFVHAGSDVVLAFTYYGHREKMRLIGKEHLLEKLNVDALKIARDVADRTGTLMAGNICNTTIYETGNLEAQEKTKGIFKEQIEWAVQYGADFIVAETFSDYGEADLALQCIKQYGNGLPSVVMIAPQTTNTTHDGLSYAEACRKLELSGADIVGLNCHRGPRTMLPLLREIRKACKCPIAALPVPYRTTTENPTMQSLKDPDTGKRSFPSDLTAQLCSRTQIEEFAKEAKEIGVQYVGLCCGNSSHFQRIVAEVYGRKPPSSKFSPDMSQHYVFGNKSNFSLYNQKGLLETVSQNNAE